MQMKSLNVQYSRINLVRPIDMIICSLPSSKFVLKLLDLSFKIRGLSKFDIAGKGLNYKYLVLCLQTSDIFCLFINRVLHAKTGGARTPI